MGDPSPEIPGTPGMYTESSMSFSPTVIFVVLCVAIVLIVIMFAISRNRR